MVASSSSSSLGQQLQGATNNPPVPQGHALVRPLPASVHSASITFCAWNASRPVEGREGGEGGQELGQCMRCTRLLAHLLLRLATQLQPPAAHKNKPLLRRS